MVHISTTPFPVIITLFWPNVLSKVKNKYKVKYKRVNIKIQRGKLKSISVMALRMQMCSECGNRTCYFQFGACQPKRHHTGFNKQLIFTQESVIQRPLSGAHQSQNKMRWSTVVTVMHSSRRGQNREFGWGAPWALQKKILCLPNIKVPPVALNCKGTEMGGSTKGNPPWQSRDIRFSKCWAL